MRIGQGAVNPGRWRDEIVDRKRPENGDEQCQKCHLPYGPKRRDVGGVEMLLRGKIPGNPG